MQQQQQVQRPDARAACLALLSISLASPLAAGEVTEGSAGNLPNSHSMTDLVPEMAGEDAA
jgi:hypothetical protein